MRGFVIGLLMFLAVGWALFLLLGVGSFGMPGLVVAAVLIAFGARSPWLRGLLGALGVLAIGNVLPRR